MADIEQQAREMLAAEYAQLGYSTGMAESPGTCRMSEAAVRVIIAALRAAPEGFMLIPAEADPRKFNQLFWAVVRAATTEEETAACKALAKAVNDDLDAAIGSAQQPPVPVTLANVKPPRNMRVRVPAVAEIKECING